MSIAALSNGGLTQLLQASSNLSGFQQALQSLSKSLGTGDLTGAKSALARLQQLNTNLTTIDGSASASSSSTKLSGDLSTLGTALNGGDLSSAQSAFTAVQQDLTGSNSAAVTAAVTVASQEVQEIDALLGLPSSGGASGGSSLGSLLGASFPDASGVDVASQTTSILSGVYGNHSGNADATPVTGTHVNVSA